MIYTVSRTFGERQTEIKGSPFVSYTLGLKEHPTMVELLQKPESPAVKEGDTIEGLIEVGREKKDGTRWLDRLKRAQKPQGGFRPRDPKETNSIVRQHSQEMALRYAMHVSPDAIVPLEQVKEWTDWFQADVAAEGPVEPPKTIREAAPTIPLDRAKTILEQARAAGHATGTELTPTLKAKLTATGVQSGLISHLNVDQAEDVEVWLRGESRGA